MAQMTLFKPEAESKPKKIRVGKPRVPGPKRKPADIFRFDPYRLPDWRLVRVSQVVEGNSDSSEDKSKRCSSYDDNYVKDMCDFLRLYNAEKPEKRRLLYSRYPGAYYAQKIRTEERPEMRLLLESQILAGRNDEEISDMLCVSPEAVDWYEQMYFNVRDRLKAVYWITYNIFGPAMQQKLNNIELPFKLYAYFGGPLVLDLMYTGFKRVPKPMSFEELDDFMSDNVFSAIRRRSAMSVHLFEVNKFNIIQLLDLTRQIHADKKATSDPAELQSSLATSVRKFLSSIKYTTGSGAEEELGPEYPLMEFDRCAAELRDHQLYSVINGQGSDYEYMKEVKFPDPPAPDSPARTLPNEIVI